MKVQLSPEHITELKENEIFVFGSNLEGRHGGIDVIKPYVDEFINFAKEHSELKFLVTRIGCGIAGFSDEEMAPLFKDAIETENIYLPKSFYYILVK